MLKNNEMKYQELIQALPETIILFDEPMAKHTTFKIGGPADCLVMASLPEEVAAVRKITRENHWPLMVIGNGSNVLVRDKGVRGVVLKFAPPLCQIRHEKNKIQAGAGALLGDVSQYAGTQGFTGLEFAIGIPGSIGGAVYMNAGAYDGEMKNVVSSVLAVSPEGELCRFTHGESDFGYRHSAFQQNGCIICQVDMELEPGDEKMIRQRMEELTRRREEKQPVEMPSAGSTFKRPEGHFAGTLIEQAGLKGFTVGGAQVSPKHAGFIINTGNATAQDVLQLIQEVQRKVEEKFQVLLHPEVRILGEE